MHGSREELAVLPEERRRRRKRRSGCWREGWGGDRENGRANSPILLYATIEIGVTRGATRERIRAGVSSNRECANSALRVMGDSLSSKFDSRAIISERAEEGEQGRKGKFHSMTRERRRNRERERGPGAASASSWKFKAAYSKSRQRRRYESMNRCSK